jgi:hypothetical protein
MIVVARYEISIEVLDAAFPASSWRTAYGDMLTATAVEWGAAEWRWVERPWGVVLEVAFRKERACDAWRNQPAVRSAFDAVPDPVNGLVFHRGWGGTSGSGEPRQPRPFAGAGAAEIPLPEDEIDLIVEAVATVSDGPEDPIRIAASA